MNRFGPPLVYLGGAVLVTVSAILLATLPSATSSYSSGLLPGLAVLGLGLPCCFAPLNAMGVSTVPPVQSGVASGVLTTFNQTGAALGLATVVTIAASHTRTLINSGQAPFVALTDGFTWGYTALIGVGVAMILLTRNFTLRRARTRA
jgi:MFS family permease